MVLKDTGQNLNKRHIRLMQNLKFSGITDDFEKKTGSGSGIDKNFGFGSGIGYPLGPDSMLWLKYSLVHTFVVLCGKEPPKYCEQGVVWCWYYIQVSPRLPSRGTIKAGRWCACD